LKRTNRSVGDRHRRFVAARRDSSTRPVTAGIDAISVVVDGGRLDKIMVPCDMLIAVNPQLRVSIGYGSRRHPAVLVLDELLLVVMCGHRVGTMCRIPVQISTLSHRQAKTIAPTVICRIATVSELTNK